MKLFILNDDLTLKEVTRSYIRLRNVLIICLFVIVVGVTTGYINAPILEKINNVHTHTTSIDTVYADNDFSKEKLVDLLYRMNIKYPHIVMAQAIVESGNFTSAVFKRNNNMFGMRQARTRITTSQGDVGGYASYRNWKECVYDYALYQYSAMNSCSNEEEYFAKLESKYAQDTAYVAALKATIKNNNLKMLFDE